MKLFVILVFAIFNLGIWVVILEEPEYIKCVAAMVRGPVVEVCNDVAPHLLKKN